MVWQTSMWGDKSEAPTTLETYTFRVMEPPAEAVSKKGERYSWFLAKQLEKPFITYKIMAFGAAKAQADKAAVDAKLTITGRAVQDLSGNTFFASGIHVPGEKKGRPRYDVKLEAIRTYGSLEKAKESLRKEVEGRLAAGYVPMFETVGELKTIHWERREHCLKVQKGGKSFWMLRIEVLMDKLGAEWVTKELKRITNGIEFEFDTGGRTKFPWVKRYREWVDAEICKLTGEGPAELFP